MIGISASRGHSGRCARGGTLVRSLPCAVLFEVGEDGPDGVWLFHAGNDLHPATAVLAGLHFSVMTLRLASRPVAMRQVIELIRSASIPSSPPALSDVVQVVEVHSRRG